MLYTALTEVCRGGKVLDAVRTAFGGGTEYTEGVLTFTSDHSGGTPTATLQPITPVFPTGSLRFDCGTPDVVRLLPPATESKLPIEAGKEPGPKGAGPKSATCVIL